MPLLRVQINLHDPNTQPSLLNDVGIDNLISLAEQFPGVHFVIPYNDKELLHNFCNALLTYAYKKDCHNIQTFYDPSCGSGLELNKECVRRHSLSHSYYASNRTKLCGASGGLNEENVVDKLIDVADAFAGHPFWSDMQTNVRKKGRVSEESGTWIADDFEGKRNRNSGDFDLLVVKAAAQRIDTAVEKGLLRINLVDKSASIESRFKQEQQTANAMCAA